MSINQEPYYKLIKIQDLSKLLKGDLIQLLAYIEKVNKEKSLLISDGTGNYSLKNIDIEKEDLKENQTIRIFGRWDGLDILPEKILDWDIPKDKITLLFTNN